MSERERKTSATVFVTGGSGYVGRPLITALLNRGHSVSALARPASAHKLPTGCTVIIGDALNEVSYQDAIQPARIFVHLVGVAHPNPAKAEQFRTIDLKSIQAAVNAARHAGVQHFIYVSVAQPAPVMKAYIEVRQAGEALLRESGLHACILRPWYVLGPGHRWPYLLVPLYWLFERLPPTREAAQRLGMVSLPQMIYTLVDAVEHPKAGINIITVQQIRQYGKRNVDKSSFTTYTTK